MYYIYLSFFAHEEVETQKVSSRIFNKCQSQD